MPSLGKLLSLEYGAPLPAEQRSGNGFPVFGSNGEVGRHDQPLVDGPGIIVGRKGSVGKVCWSDGSFWPIDTTYWVKCEGEQRRWIYWLLCRLPLSKLDSSTGVPGLNRNDVYELTVFEPAASGEKVKIAEVLDTLDTTIRQTEAIIEKLKQVKRGLLHDLLTRGIDANGELRPPQSQAPHLYKDSPLGCIPRDWIYGTAAEWCDRLSVGIVTGSTQAYVPMGVPFIRSQDVKPNRIEIDKVLHISKSFSAANSKSRLSPGDVVIVRTGYPGTAAVVPLELEGANCFSLVVATPASTRLNSYFLAQYMNSSIGKTQIGRLQFGSAQHNFNVGEMRLLPTPIPPLLEQSSIVKIMDMSTARIDATGVELAKLRALKSGLMDDLLTGRVRVTSLLDTASRV